LPDSRPKGSSIRAIANSARGFVDGPFGADDPGLPLVGTLAAQRVGQGHRHLRVAGLRGQGDEIELPRGQREPDFGEVGGEDLAQRGRASDRLAETDRALLHAAVEGRADFGPFEVPHRLLEVGLGGIDGRPGFLELGNPQDQLGRLLVVAEVLPVEAGLFGPGLLLDQHRLGPREPRLRGGHRDLEIRGIQFRQHVVLGEESTVFKAIVDFDDVAGDLRGDGGGVVRPHAALAIEQDREVGPLEFEDFGFENLRRGGLGLGGFHGNPQAPGGESAEGEDDHGNEQAEEHQVGEVPGRCTRETRLPNTKAGSRGLRSIPVSAPGF
jgi:hypothetical protein